MLPHIHGDFGIVQEPELRFNTNGQPWLKIRGKAADRAFNAETREWEDKGDPMYLDIIVGGKAAENLYESVTIGDQIVVSGKLTYREWTDGEGNKRNTYQLRADSIGVGVTYGPARSNKMAGVHREIPQTGGTEDAVDSTAAPF